MYGAMRSRDWGNMGWRRYHFRGRGELEGEIQLCLATREHLQTKTSLAALLPEICHMGELVVGKGVGSGGTKELEGAW